MPYFFTTNNFCYYKKNISRNSCRKHCPPAMGFFYICSFWDGLAFTCKYFYFNLRQNRPYFFNYFCRFADPPYDFCNHLQKRCNSGRIFWFRNDDFLLLHSIYVFKKAAHFHAEFKYYKRKSAENCLYR